MIADGLIDTVVQPIVDLDTGVVKAVESLARFPSEPRRGPDVWFAEAEAVGLGVELEDACGASLAAPARPAPGSIDLRLEHQLRHARLGADDWGCSPVNRHRRMFVELTEHVMFGDYEPGA